MRRAIWFPIARAAALLALLSPLLAAAPPRPPRPGGVLPPLAHSQRARFLMGTVCTGVVGSRADSTAAGEALDAAFDEIARLESVMSSWQSESELQRLNAAAASERFACSADLYAVIDSALDTAAETGGSFDPTIEPLARAWDLRGPGRVPEESELAEARAHVGWRSVVREPMSRVVRFTRPGMGLDLGGIGKGYALDRAADLLRSRGTLRALLNFGGEVVALSDREPWKITVAHPADRTQPAVALGLSNAAASTSSQSERGIEANGVRYGHILDPRTGRPARTEASVTVVAASGTRADALSTALLVMGRERSLEFARTHPDIGVLWLEPLPGEVDAWSWNLPTATAEPGVTVRWMNRP